MRYLFDLETDGLLDTVTKIHCINVIDRVTGERLRFNEGVYHDGTPSNPSGSIRDGVELLRGQDVVGQNIVRYDLPVLELLYPGFKVKSYFDTLVASSVIWTNLTDVDFSLLRTGKLPKEFAEQGLIGKQSLKAWGYRLGFRKGDFDPKDYGHTWATVPFMKDMDDYCAQDCEVTQKWMEKIDGRNYSRECLDLEHQVARIIFLQERWGFGFDVPAAEALTAQLQVRHAELSAQLVAQFPPWTVETKRAIAKVGNKKLGRVKGEEYVVTKEVVFNPASRDHIADRLMTLRGWKPAEFTEGGKPKVDETVLESLPWPEAKLLSEYLMVEKRIGQVATGKEGWLKKVRNGRIHGRVNSNGAVTGRMTHSSPNVAQVPAGGAPYGKECRALFRPVTPGYVQVGCDAEGLELRALAHYMGKYDGGAYGVTVDEGRKEDKTDVHNVNKAAAGLNSRDSAKTFIYALLYGAGDYKIGTIVFDDFTDEQKTAWLEKNRTKAARDKALTALGRERRDRIMRSLPAFGELVKAVKAKARKDRKLTGLDGRVLHVRSEHAALNTLLQSAGAVVMKKALVLFDACITDDQELNGKVNYLANVHDEVQLECPPEVAQRVGQLFADCIFRAGEHYRFRCPLRGAYEVGANWAETH